jgi:hypothetical protein
MAVIPTIFDMPDRLHARAMASNNLSSGAIAGIVLSCVFGLILVLVTPPRNEKPVVVDAKRVLGLDDASYLDALPSQNGEHSMGTAEDDGIKEMTGQGSNASASLPVEDTSLGAPKPSSSLRSKTWANATFGPSNIYRASGVDAKHECMDTTLDGSEIKYHRVSELTGFRKLTITDSLDWLLW